MKYAIDLISGKLTNSEYSHKNGWAYLRKHQLEFAYGNKIDVLHGENWDNYDVIYLYHGMEQDGNTLNLFGGATKESALPYERLLKYKDKTIISLDIDMPDYGKLCKNRLSNADEYWKSINWDEISIICKNIKPLKNPYSIQLSPKIIIGDSHSFSAYLPGYITIRKDGRTLAGVLKKTIKKEIQDYISNNCDIIESNLLEKVTHLTCYYGNIDIRHHLCRYDNPISELKMLLDEYENQLKCLNIPNIEIVGPLPIEDESRKLPKTGYFKGAPFYGSIEDRKKLVNFMKNYLKDICIKNNWKLFLWPEEWYTITSTMFMETYMERRQSVHLAPKYHRTDLFGKHQSLLNF